MLSDGPGDARPPPPLDHRPRSRRPQPMPSQDGSLWLTFNGEIYNYSSCATSCERAGTRSAPSRTPRCCSRAYARVGRPTCSTRLNGMFAFAIWDSASGDRSAARDRFGVKPLYYTAAGGPASASRPRSRRCSSTPPCRARAERRRVLEFLAYGLATTRTRRCSTGVQQLPPGSYLEVTPTRRCRTPRPLVHAAARRARRSKPLGARHARAARRRRHAATEQRRAGRRVALRRHGLVLGARGCVVAALGRGASRRRSRSPPARATRRPTSTPMPRRSSPQPDRGTPRCCPSFDGLVDELDSIVWHMDEPFHSPSVYGQRKVDEFARNAGVIVLLDGQGGDEVLSGYHHFHYPPLLLSLLRRGRLGPVHTRAARAQAADRHVTAAVDERRRAAARRSVPPHDGRPDWLAPGRHCPEPAEPVVEPRGAPGLRICDRAPPGVQPPCRSQLDDVLARDPQSVSRRPLRRGSARAPERGASSTTATRSGRCARRCATSCRPRSSTARASRASPPTRLSGCAKAPSADDFERTFSSESFARRGYFDPPKLLAALREHRAGGSRAAELWRAYVVERWFRLFIDPEQLTPPSPPASAVRSSVAALDELRREATAAMYAPRADRTRPLESRPGTVPGRVQIALGRRRPAQAEPHRPHEIAREEGDPGGVEATADRDEQGEGGHGRELMRDRQHQQPGRRSSAPNRSPAGRSPPTSSAPTRATIPHQHDEHRQAGREVDEHDRGSDPGDAVHLGTDDQRRDDEDQVRDLDVNPVLRTVHRLERLSPEVAENVLHDPVQGQDLERHDRRLPRAAEHHVDERPRNEHDARSTTAPRAAQAAGGSSTRCA